MGASKDNTLYEDANGSLSNGAGKYFFAGRTATGSIRRGLVEFNVAGAVPSGATITSVSLTIHMSRIPPGPTKLILVTLHPVLKEWGERSSAAAGNGGAGAPSAQGDATWRHTSFPTQDWSNLGGDFGSSIASKSVGGIGSYTWSSTSRMISDVQLWADAGSRNHGWLLKGNESSSRTAKRFDSRENSDPNRPELTITYIPP